MEISNVGLQLIRDFEGCKLEAYLCQAKKWTIGVGHTATAKQGMKITEEKALQLLDSDLGIVEDVVNIYVKVPLTQGQFDALVSLTFNIGVNGFKNSTLLSNLNRKDYKTASEQFLVWNKYTDPKDKIKKVSDGLTRRRKAEKGLFDTNSYNGKNASSTNTVTVTNNTGEWKLETGTFTLGKNINLRESASTKGKLIGTLKKGDKVKYIAYKVDKNGYVWIKQKRSSGYGYLATGETKNGKRIDYWGKFS